MTEKHSTHSVFREKVAEHLFVGELLRRLWQLDAMDAEVLRAEFDAGGYDAVFAWRGIVRHVQFKTVLQGGRTRFVKAGLKLADRPGGCIIWIVVSNDLELLSYRWFGGAPGETLPDIEGFKVAKHTKHDSKKTRAERAGHREIPKSRFETLDTVDQVIERLFGRAVFESGR